MYVDDVPSIKRALFQLTDFQLTTMFTFIVSQLSYLSQNVLLTNKSTYEYVKYKQKPSYDVI